MNDTCALNTTNAPTCILQIKKMEDKIYGLNILVTNVTNLIAAYLQLLLVPI
jgi:hypothetical protein